MSATELLPDDFYNLFKERMKDNIEKQYDDVIKYLRWMEKKEPGSGKKELHELLQNGTLKLGAALNIVPLLDDLERPYSIKILD
jgi:hypothetical protein